MRKELLPEHDIAQLYYFVTACKQLNDLEEKNAQGGIKKGQSPQLTKN